jgi:hypothetical protein
MARTSVSDTHNIFPANFKRNDIKTIRRVCVYVYTTHRNLKNKIHEIISLPVVFTGKKTGLSHRGRTQVWSCSRTGCTWRYFGPTATEAVEGEENWILKSFMICTPHQTCGWSDKGCILKTFTIFTSPDFRVIKGWDGQGTKNVWDGRATHTGFC